MTEIKLVEDKVNTGRYHFWIVLAAAAIGVVVSLIWFIHDGVNYQETYNLHLSMTKGLSSIFAYGSNDDPMPLYFILLSSFNGLIGHASLYLDRLISLLSYVLLVIVAYFVGRLATKSSLTGVVSAILVAFSPFMIWYANRATVYSLLALVVALNQLFFIAIFRKKNWGLPFYFLTSLIGLGLHFFFLAIIIPEFLFLIFRHSELKKYQFWLTFLSIVITLTAFVAWVLYSTHNSVFWHYLPYTSNPSATNTFIIYFQYLFGFQSVVITTLIISLWPLLVILSLLAVQKYVRPPEAVKYLFINAVLPIILLFILSWVWRPLFLSSYLIVCLPAFLIFIAWYLTAYKLQVLSLARYTLILGMLIMLTIEVINWHLALQQDYLGLTSSKPLIALVGKKH